LADAAPINWTNAMTLLSVAILVGTDGHVSEIHVLEKLEPGLDARAITAVSKWRFKPAMLGTTPVAFRARAGVSFSEQ